MSTPFYGKESWFTVHPFVNKTPFHTGPQSTFFVGSISTFSIETFSNQMQNLGGFDFGMEFLPGNKNYPYGSLNYFGEYGSSFQSNLFWAELGMMF